MKNKKLSGMSCSSVYVAGSCTCESWTSGYDTRGHSGGRGLQYPFEGDSHSLNSTVTSNFLIYVLLETSNVDATDIRPKMIQ